MNKTEIVKKNKRIAEANSFEKVSGFILVNTSYETIFRNVALIIPPVKIHIM
jgi:hypothetical protein